MNLNYLTETLEIVTRGGERLRDKVLSVPEGTRLVREATNNEHWGPSGTDMSKVADMTHNFKDFGPIMQTLWERFTETSPLGPGKNWRNIYKALLLLDYLLRNGSEKVVNEARQNSWEVKELVRFHFIDSDGVDRGVSIRERAKQVVDLIHDTQRLREERKKSRSVRDKFNQSIGSNQDLWDSQSYHRNRNKKNDWEGEWGTNPGGGRGTKTAYVDSSDEEKEKSEEENEDDGFASLREPKKTNLVQKNNPAPAPSATWNPFENKALNNNPAEEDWAEFIQAPAPAGRSGDLGTISFPPPPRTTNPTNFPNAGNSTSVGVSLLPPPSSISGINFPTGPTNNTTAGISFPTGPTNNTTAGIFTGGSTNTTAGISFIGGPTNNTTVGMFPTVPSTGYTSTPGGIGFGNPMVGNMGNPMIGNVGNTGVGDSVGKSDSRTRALSGSKPVIDKTDPWANPHLFDLSAIAETSKSSTPVTQHLGQNMFRTDVSQATGNMGGYGNFPPYIIPGIYGYPTTGYGAPSGY